MGTRTIQFLGKAYADSGDVNVVATLNGTEVYNGPVPTTPGQRPMKNPPGNWEVLFQFDVPDTMFNMLVPSTFAVSGGDLIIVTFQANKLDVNDLTAFIPNFEANIKQNIVIDGDPVTLVEDPGDTGTFHLVIPDGSTASLDWQLRDIPYGLPGHPRPLGSTVGPEYGPPY